jgi:hypothetical protein
MRLLVSRFASLVVIRGELDHELTRLDAAAQRSGDVAARSVIPHGACGQGSSHPDLDGARKIRVENGLRA